MLYTIQFTSSYIAQRVHITYVMMHIWYIAQGTMLYCQGVIQHLRQYLPLAPKRPHVRRLQVTRDGASPLPQLSSDSTRSMPTPSTGGLPQLSQESLSGFLCKYNLKLSQDHCLHKFGGPELENPQRGPLFFLYLLQFKGNDGQPFSG